MFRVSACVLVGFLFVLSGGLVGQEKKQESKKDEVKKDEVKKDEGKAKGMLPANWKKLGLSDDQVQKIYKIQSKYGEEIDKLEAKIAELKATMDKERRAVLTADQKKRLEEILLGKDK